MQEHWQKVRAAEGWNSGAGDGGASVLRVIGHAAARFPDSQASSLCMDLMKVTLKPCMQSLHFIHILNAHMLAPSHNLSGWKGVHHTKDGMISQAVLDMPREKTIARAPSCTE